MYLEDAHDAGMKEISYTDNGEEKTEMCVSKLNAKCVACGPLRKTLKERRSRRGSWFPRLLCSTKALLLVSTLRKSTVDYVPRGTLMQFRVRRSFYSSPMSYGTNNDFRSGRHYSLRDQETRSQGPFPSLRVLRRRR